MALILRSVKGSKLTTPEMDGNLTYLASTLSGSIIQVTGSSIDASNTIITASLFVGDGSGLTGVTSEWDGTYQGNADITGSLMNGDSNVTVGDFSHAEGFNTVTSGAYSHAEGYNSITYGNSSHAEGFSTITIGNYSHAEGNNTIASGSFQHVTGKYNIHGDTTSLFIVGGGLNTSSRKDAFKVTHSSSIVVATQSTVPAWAGIEGEMVPGVNGGNYYIYTYIGGQWRSSSLS